MGDICILIGGLKVVKLLPKAGKPHWGSGRQFGWGQACAGTARDQTLLCIFHRISPSLSLLLFLLSPILRAYGTSHTLVGQKGSLL